MDAMQMALDRRSAAQRAVSKIMDVLAAAFLAVLVGLLSPVILLGAVFYGISAGARWLRIWAHYGGDANAYERDRWRQS